MSNPQDVSFGPLGADDRATLNVPEVAKLLGCSRTSAYRWVKDGTLPAIRLGRRVVVPRNALEQLLREGSPTLR